jgi:hypothetical protein
LRNTAGGNGGKGVSSAQGEGGAIAAFGDVDATVANSSFSGNRAGGNGGEGTSSAEGDGGAVEFFGESPAASLSVTGSTFESNEAGGSVGVGSGSGAGVGGGVEAGGEGSARVLNDTFRESNANHGEGGGFASAVPATLLNDTLSGNAATGGTGGNLAVLGATTTLKNTIIVGGAAISGSNCFVLAGSLTSAGHNLEDTAPSQCGLGTGGDKVGVNPLLGELQGNGGPTETQALLPGSPAIDAGDDIGCPATDERGVLRPAGAACDIGAFEVATPAVSTGQATSIASSSATLSGTFTNPDIASGSAFYQYGTTTEYGSQTPAQAIGADTSQAPISATVTGLSPGTTYHFRAVVANAIGTVLGGDQTFKSATKSGTTPTAAGVAPVLAALAVHPSKVRPYPNKGASLIAKSRPRGATIGYRDSEPANTTLVVQRQVSGYLLGRRCLGRRPANHRGRLKRCTLFVGVGSFTHADSVGANHLHFTGRVGGKPLPVGRYRLRAVARNASGQTSRAVTASFSIVR